MFGFGDAFVSAYASAKESAKKAFDKTVQVVGETAAKANEVRKEFQAAAGRAAVAVAGAVVAGVASTAQAAKQVAVAAADKAHDVAVAVGRAAKKVAVATSQAVKGAAAAAVQQAKGAAVAVKQTAVAAKNAAVNKVRAAVGQKPMGPMIEECPNRSKAQRVAQRRSKVDKAKQKLATMPASRNKERLAKAVERFEFNNRAVERARLSHHAYQIKDDPSNPPPQGWSKPSREELEKLGIKPELFPRFQPRFDPDRLQDKPGFYADIYKSDPNVFGEEQYVVVYRGTVGGEDWTENAKQAFGGESEHYNKAMRISAGTSRALGGQVEFTGHSLGGGLATAAGLSSGQKATGFNPAGVHPATLARKNGSFTREDAAKGPDGKPLVENVVVRGEILTKLQEKGNQRALIAVGTAAGVAAAPAATGAATGALLASDDAGQALRDQGTLTYGMAGTRHEVPPIGNAREVTEKTSRGEAVQAMSPSLQQKIGDAATLGYDLHGMDYVIAGMEQQKSDDLASIGA